ncbi:MAG TPA: UDP-N-acetylmuramoylalanyl-D-glutamyl-2,6-diaminopimelate--D-alanyl-D-alanine ligase [Xanthobacteraceae bacterium]|nr:UDP-N-acetylmuramoylalanyl-D-glutamyl-2,6-diaminopimelate--D-alanyl-D-alanine ligase [Xanthobacteraceae bacterium]
MSEKALWALPALVAATGGRLLGSPPAAIEGISIDSRTIGADEAFFAIKGERVDGHAYVGNALGRGAALAVVAEAKLAEMPKGALLVVPDVLDALRALARAARARSAAKIVAVTGSVGKTGTKEALRFVLSRDGETHASASSYNNHWGVPLSLARLPMSARFGVFELGMNHASEITPLARLVHPHVAIITTIEPVHLEFFPGIEAIADAKAEIFTGLAPGGAAVINRDNSQFERLAAAARKTGARVVGFGAHQDAEARLIDAALGPEGSTVRAVILGDDIAYKLGAPGRHLAVNSLAVLATAKLVGADLALAGLALARLQPPKGRGDRFRLTFGKGEVLLIDESYNANPASMRAALDVLGRAPVGPKGRRIAVLGDMLELGPEGPALHRALAAAVEEAGIDLVFAAGPLMQNLWEALPADRRGGYAESTERIEALLVAALRPGDAIMIKGSNGSRMGPLAKKLVERFRLGEPAEDATA